MKTTGLIKMLIRYYSKKKGRKVKRAKEKIEKETYRQIWNDERKEYYLEARDTFNRLCHEGKIRKQEQRELRELLENLIAGYMQEYRHMKFKNEFHRIYVYLKCWHLDEADWQHITKYLNGVQ